MKLTTQWCGYVEYIMINSLYNATLHSSIINIWHENVQKSMQLLNSETLNQCNSAIPKMRKLTICIFGSNEVQYNIGKL